jgi:hypothetical protein
LAGNTDIFTTIINQQQEEKMKKIKLAAMALALFGILAGGNAFALDTATITVSANVLGTCTFDTTTYTMAFGAIDPLMAADATVNVGLAFTCTNGSNYALDDVSGIQTMTGSGANTLGYSIDPYALTGTGTGATQNVSILGRITSAQAQIAAVDTYNDSLTINLNPTP